MHARPESEQIRVFWNATTSTEYVGLIVCTYNPRQRLESSPRDSVFIHLRIGWLRAVQFALMW